MDYLEDSPRDSKISPYIVFTNFFPSWNVPPQEIWFSQGEEPQDTDTEAEEPPELAAKTGLLFLILFHCTLQIHLAVGPGGFDVSPPRYTFRYVLPNVSGGGWEVPLGTNEFKMYNVYKFVRNV